MNIIKSGLIKNLKDWGAGAEKRVHLVKSFLFENIFLKNNLFEFRKYEKINGKFRLRKLFYTWLN